MKRAAIYARVRTNNGQKPEMQLVARSWKTEVGWKQLGNICKRCLLRLI